MTALSPAEQAEVTRFGMFDEDILRDMETHWDDALSCSRCDHDAAWKVVCRGGCARGALCDTCLDKVRAENKTVTFRCDYCQKVAPEPGFDAIVRVMPL